MVSPPLLWFQINETFWNPVKPYQYYQHNSDKVDSFDTRGMETVDLFLFAKMPAIEGAITKPTRENKFPLVKKTLF